MPDQVMNAQVAERDFSLRAVKKLDTAGHDGLSLVHTNLLAHPDTACTRTTTLAERAGITKQVEWMSALLLIPIGERS